MQSLGLISFPPLNVQCYIKFDTFSGNPSQKMLNDTFFVASENRRVVFPTALGIFSDEMR